MNLKTSYIVFHLMVMCLTAGLTLQQNGFKKASTKHDTPPKVTNSKKAPESVCNTEGCKQVAEMWKGNMKEEVDPCENFYEYACGNWDKKFPGANKSDGFEITGERARRTLRQLYKRGHPPKSNDKATASDIKLYKKTKTFYQSCMNHMKNDVNGKKNKEIIRTRLNQMKVLGATYNPTILSEMIAEAHDMGSKAMISTYIQYNRHKRFQKTLDFDELAYSLYNRWNYAYEDDLNVLIRFVDVLLKDFFGAQYEKDNQNQKLASDVVQFEKKLVHSLPPPGFWKNPNDFIYADSTAKLNQKYPNIDFTALVAAKWRKLGVKTPKHMNSFVISQPTYYTKLNDLLKNTPTVVINYYIKFKILFDNLRHFDHQTFKLYGEYAKYFDEDDPEKITRLDCYETTVRTFPWAFGRWYINEQFPNQAAFLDTKKNILDKVKTQYKSALKSNPRIESEADKKAMIEKLDGYEWRVGSTASLMNTEELNALYDVEINDINVLENIRKVERNIEMKKWIGFDGTYGLDQWKYSPQSAYAFSFAAEHRVELPAGIFQAPLYYPPEYPEYLRFGSMGWVIAHEQTHGFDDNGHHFNQKAEVRPWLTDSTLKSFKNQYQCFNDQQRSLPSKYSNGKEFNSDPYLVQGENMADATGLRVAYNTWVEVSKTRNHNPKLPGFEKMTTEQLFFMTFANNLCGKLNDYRSRWFAAYDPHPMGAARVNGATQNSQAFQLAFNCKKGNKQFKEINQQCYII